MAAGAVSRCQQIRAKLIDITSFSDIYSKVQVSKKTQAIETIRSRVQLFRRSNIGRLKMLMNSARFLCFRLRPGFRQLRSCPGPSGLRFRHRRRTGAATGTGARRARRRRTRRWRLPSRRWRRSSRRWRGPPRLRRSRRRHARGIWRTRRLSRRSACWRSRRSPRGLSGRRTLLRRRMVRHRTALLWRAVVGLWGRLLLAVEPHRIRLDLRVKVAWRGRGPPASQAQGSE